jgi:hypothetical protein
MAANETPGSKFTNLATWKKQADELDVAPKKKDEPKKDAKPSGMSDKAYQDTLGQWHEPGQRD